MSVPQRAPRGANRKVHARKLALDRKTQEARELEELRKRVQEEPARSDTISTFSDLPISSRTKQGLEAAHFLTPTDIQKAAIPPALAGCDILGAARTGSGKTLAFLVPLLEALYRNDWGPLDGLGALVLSPTRELALQTFEVLRRIGRLHSLSAGLIIGGKSLRDEQDAIARMNILIATPGRLLQHLDQTQGFDWSNLQVLVLDEADRILDLGFSRTIDAILDALPRDRQTLLFSATQTESVDALARLSLRRDPVKISLGGGGASAAGGPSAGVTPEQLEQKYVLCPLQEKYDRLYSFIKAHVHSKTIIFFSSCKEVRFTFEAFCRLQPGVPLLHLHGRQKQLRRVDIFTDFCRKPHAVLFATDVAARGLDFPAVDWVVQADCPEDVDTYIHRVGRTARLDQAGKALLFLLPSEIAMLDLLKAKGIPITSLYPKIANGQPLPPPKRPIRSQLAALCTQDLEVKYLAQKALVSYVRSVFLHGNKQVFKVAELPVAEFAASLGLASTPKLRFVSRSLAKNVSRDALRAAKAAPSEGEEEREPSNVNTPFKRIDKLFKRKNIDVYSEHYRKLRDSGSDDDDDAGAAFSAKPKKDTLARHSKGEGEEDFLTVKRRDHEIDLGQLPAPKGAPAKLSRRDILKTKKKYALKQAPQATHLVFDEDDEARPVLPFTPETLFDRGATEQLAEAFVTQGRAHMASADKEDAERVKQARRQKLAAKRQKERDAARSAQAAKAPRLGD